MISFEIPIIFHCSLFVLLWSVAASGILPYHYLFNWWGYSCGLLRTEVVPYFQSIFEIGNALQCNQYPWREGGSSGSESSGVDEDQRPQP